MAEEVIIIKVVVVSIHPFLTLTDLISDWKGPGIKSKLINLCPVRHSDNCVVMSWSNLLTSFGTFRRTFNLGPNALTFVLIILVELFQREGSGSVLQGFRIIRGTFRAQPERRLCVLCFWHRRTVTIETFVIFRPADQICRCYRLETRVKDNNYKHLLSARKMDLCNTNRQRKSLFFL